MGSPRALASRAACKYLARLASEVLTGKKKLHDLVGTTASWLVLAAGGSHPAQAFARELARNIPLPPDAKLIATARGIQLSGIALCLAKGDDLTRCQCFIDLATSETKTRVKRILTAGIRDWANLDQFRQRRPGPNPSERLPGRRRQAPLPAPNAIWSQ